MKEIEIVYLGTEETDREETYWRKPSFEERYKPIISYLLTTAAVRDVVHTVPGGPAMAAKVKEMLEHAAQERAEKWERCPFDVQPLVQVMAALRGPQGCPWDKKQTHRSLRRFLLEEVYETLDAIDKDDKNGICEELGDILYQVIIHARIAEEEGLFTAQDIVTKVCDKMIRRHPYVFHVKGLENMPVSMLNWDRLKQRERRQQHKRLLDGVVGGMPSLLTAYKLQEKSAGVGFEWDTDAAVWAKAAEEWQEFREALQEGDAAHAEEEAGDVLFIFANVCRRYHIEPECALHRANKKFYRRFSYVEEKVRQSGKPWQMFSLAQLDAFWQEAKRQERRQAL